MRPSVFTWVYFLRKLIHLTYISPFHIHVTLYRLPPTDMVFSSSELQRTFTVDIAQDALFESPDDTFRVVLACIHMGLLSS